jgi:C-terminal processing protease CtpA/Prc
MNMKTLHCILLIVLGLASAGCSEADDPLSCFDVLWQDFDMQYGQFEVKGIDWTGVRDRHRPRLNHSSSDDELFKVLSDVLAELDDNHVHLYGHGRAFRSGILGRLRTMTDFKLDVVRTHYLTEPKSAAAGVITYGLIPPNIGYIHIAAMLSDGAPIDAAGMVREFDRVLTELGSCPGLIVDVRGNQGGKAAVSEAIANRFADTRRLAMKMRLRNGPGHGDFTKPVLRYTKPTDSPRFLGPVVLLTNRFSNSAAELFTIRMRLFPNVTHLGDITAGANDGPIARQLPNRWVYHLPLGLTTDANDVCYEGIGITPQILVTNDTTSLEQGIDQILEAGIARF